MLFNYPLNIKHFYQRFIFCIIEIFQYVYYVIIMYVKYISVLFNVPTEGMVKDESRHAARWLTLFLVGVTAAFHEGKLSS